MKTGRSLFSLYLSSLPFLFPPFLCLPPFIFQVELMLYFCEVSGVCHMQGAVLNIPLKCSDSAASSALTEVLYSPEVPKTT